MIRPTRLLAIVSLLIAASAQAIVYIVPKDRDLVLRSDAIVIATAIESHAEPTAAGGIATIATIRVDSVLKGKLGIGELRLTEPGGMLSDRMLIIVGSPRFTDGKSYLLFLRNVNDSWMTYGLQLGQFEITSDSFGRKLVTRTGGESLYGLNEADGSSYTDRYRDAEKFIQFIRAADRTAATPALETYFVPREDVVATPFRQLQPRPNLRIVPNFTRGNYLLSGNPRWQSGPTATIGYCCPGSYPTVGGVNGPSAAGSAATAWNGHGSIAYVAGGETPGKTGGLSSSDGSNTILFNDPGNYVSSCCPGAVAVGGITIPSGGYTLGGESFSGITEVDVVVEKNSSLPSFISQSLLTSLLTHEVGHTLGFRHSDGTALNTSPPPNCDPSTNDCASTTNAAVMIHVITAPGIGLQAWDGRAADTVYGAGPVCNSPSSASAGASPGSISLGQSTQLTANVTGGSSPFNFQWYRGNSGDQSNPIGTNSSSISQSPTSTTTYWVKVTATCGGSSVNSSATTVTVTCTSPSISAQPSNASSTAGSNTQLSVIASGSSLTYQWYVGTTGNTGTPIPGATGSAVNVSPTSTTSYWVRVSGACGSPVDSSTATITVAPCTAPAITTQPQSTSVAPGGTAVISVGATGSNLTYQWFFGNSGNTSNPIGATTNAISVTPTTTTTVWVRVSGACGSPVDSNSATVTIGTACNTTVSSISSSANPVLPGQSFTLTANASTTSGTLSYQWYRGSLGNTANPIGTGQTVTVTQSAATTYWVNVTSSCGGNAVSQQINITMNTGACGSNANQLCINNARYRVTLTARDPSGNTGQGVALYQSNVFGYFSLPSFTGDAGNPEVFVKIVEFAGRPWVFYAGLTNLDYTLTVQDTVDSAINKQYHVAPPPVGSFKNFGNFDVDGATSNQCDDVTISTSNTSTGTCSANANTLCLLGNRFAVTLFGQNNPTRGTESANGLAVPVNNVFGFFTTPPPLSGDPNDIQAFVKMVDARAFSGNFWVFLGGLTDFRLTFTVTDTQTGQRKTYLKPAGSTCGWNDTVGFPF